MHLLSCQYHYNSGNVRCAAYRSMQQYYPTSFARWHRPWVGGVGMILTAVVKERGLKTSHPGVLCESVEEWAYFHRL